MKQIIARLIVLALGVAMLTGAWFGFASKKEFFKNAQSAVGEVVAVESVIGSDGRYTYRPIVRFTTSDGRVIETSSSAGFDRPHWAERDTVDVFYDPAAPYEIELGKGFIAWLVPIILTPMGIAFLLGGIFGKPVKEQEEASEHKTVSL